jgi:hypothetical protein
MTLRLRLRLSKYSKAEQTGQGQELVADGET